MEPISTCSCKLRESLWFSLCSLRLNQDSLLVSSEKVMQNPFVIGKPIEEQEFLGHAEQIRRIVGRIVNGGQSVAVTVEPSMGKASLLRYLSAPEKRAELYGELAPFLLIKYMDSSVLSPSFSQRQFWQMTLQPLAENLMEINSQAVNEAYETCKKEEFAVYSLERLLAELQSAGWHIVLMVNEFNALLDHPVLNKSEFYAGLRSLATRFESLTLVTACRLSLEELNAATQAFNQMGSPYFNFMAPISIAAFAEKEVGALLSHGDEHFDKADKKFLFYIAGGHPALILAAAYALWDAYEYGETDRLTRWEQASSDLLEVARPILSNTWGVWTPEKRKAVTIVALDTLPRLVAGKEFDIEALLASFTAYIPEVDELRKGGFLVTDNNTHTGYRLQAQVMYWWLGEKLIRETRPQEEEDVGQWLRDQEWEGLITHKEKAQLKDALTALGGLLKTGTEVFIKAAAEGFAKGLTDAK